MKAKKFQNFYTKDKSKKLLGDEGLISEDFKIILINS